jgi:hypothetical protein
MVSVDDGKELIDRVASYVSQTFTEALPDGILGLVKIVDYPVADALGRHRSHAQRFKVPFRTQTSHDGDDFTGADVDRGVDRFTRHC